MLLLLLFLSRTLSTLVLQKSNGASLASYLLCLHNFNASWQSGVHRSPLVGCCIVEKMKTQRMRKIMGQRCVATHVVDTHLNGFDGLPIVCIYHPVASEHIVFLVLILLALFRQHNYIRRSGAVSRLPPCKIFQRNYYV